jgi:ADP-heptose:LPS heptosyltransferase
LLGALGVPPISHRPRLAIPPAAGARAEARLQSVGLPAGAPRVGFHCFTVSRLRTWPAERFAAVIDRLSAEAGARGVVLGARAEEPEAEQLLAQTQSRPVSLVGRTSLNELAALISRLDLVVCLDSGLLHLAAAVGVPTVSLFGPGDPARWQPLHGEHSVLWRGLPCSPCRDLRCIHAVNRCMQEIGVEEVVAAAKWHLQRRGAP